MITKSRHATLKEPTLTAALFRLLRLGTAARDYGSARLTWPREAPEQAARRCAMPKRDTSRRDRRRADDGASLSRSARPLDSDVAGGRSHSSGDQYKFDDVDIEQGRQPRQPRGNGHSTVERAGTGDTSRHGGNSGRSPTISPDRSSARADQPLSPEVYRDLSPRTQIVDEEEPTPVQKMASVVRRSQTVNEAASGMNDSAGIDDAVPKDDGASPSRASARPYGADAAIARGRSPSNDEHYEYYEHDLEQGRQPQQPRRGHATRHGVNSSRSPPTPVQKMASVVHRSRAVNKAANSMKDSAGIDEGVPKVAFMRVNIMDVLEYDDKEKRALVKLYLEVAWRRKDAERHHLEKKPKEEEVKWTNADEKTTNDVPDEFWQQACPFSFSKTHPVSDLLDNYIPSVDTETWNSWFQLDHTAEEKFEKMEPKSAPLDPNGKLQPVRSALPTAQREPASHSASAYLLCISIVSLY
eukprot:COSAG06_NODE_1963_length_7972_cov_10.409628_4_plen_469_part_00